MDILQEIARLRLERGWTEYELAKRANLTQSTISTWYSKQQTPTIRTLEQVCHGLGITLSQFFAQGKEPVALTEEQQTLLDQWAKLTEEQRSLLLAFLQTI